MSTRIVRPELSTILAVDDDVTARMMMRLALMASGLRVVEASSGREALEVFDRERPDLVLMDVHMPDMDGFECCAAMRSRPWGEAVPLVMMTGDDRPEMIQAAYEAGATDFEAKGVPARVLGQRVLFLLRAKRTLDRLHESEKRLESAQRLARMGHWEWDIATDLHSWSATTYGLLGVPSEVSLPCHADFLANVHPHDLAHLGQALHALRHSGRSYVLDHRVVLPEGAELHLQQRAEPVMDAGGELVGVAGTLLDITELRRAEDQIRKLAYYDSVTGLPNRVLFNERLALAIAEAARRGSNAAIIFLDLDNFKTVNDTFGHGAGDQLLKEVAERLNRAIRTTDTVTRLESDGGDLATLCRMGGDEFIVLLSDVQEQENVGRAASRMMQVLRQPIHLEATEVIVTASAGISIYPQDGADASTLVKNADSAMYAAKNAGRNLFRFFDPALNERTAKRLFMETGLRQAIHRGEFRLHYQPIMDSFSGRVIGGECLLRWQHPELGLIYPGQFISIAEDTGMIVSLDEWVVRRACLQQLEWSRAGEVVPLSFNISGRHFQLEDFGDRLEAILLETGADPGLLTMEITESVLLTNTEVAERNLHRVRLLGLNVALDDFGTGYSSLSYLRRFPVDRIKVDRSFVNDLEEESDAVAVAEIIAVLARRLGIEPLAEGVESQSQRRILEGLGYKEMQGFLFSKAVPAEEFRAFLAERNTVVPSPV